MREVKITDFKTKRINSLTGGIISDYKIQDYPADIGDGVLRNSFTTKSGLYIGDYATGWWYVKKKLKVCEDYPHGAAEFYEDDNLVGYYGYTHRGGCLFKVGDRLFDEKYQPVKEDYKDDQWDKWEAEFNEKYKNADDFDREHIYDNISAIIPFNMRGREIKNLSESKQAAINLSKYLS
jgi:hypothetical protein